MGRYALLVAIGEYADARLSQLRSPEQDAERLAVVLEDAEIGGFDRVDVLRDATDSQVRTALDQILSDRDRDDLVLVYFSCHGQVTDQRRLYFACTNTDYDHPAGSSIARSFVNELMEDCPAAGRILLLDCCFSGAFAQGFKAASAGPLEGQVGHGYVVMTASDEYEYAFEEDSMSLESPRVSIFTDVMTQGLASGAADLDGDGRVTIDELFRYTHEAVVRRRPDQKPKLFAYSVEPNLFIARAAARNDTPDAARPTSAQSASEHSALAQGPGQQAASSGSTLSRQHLVVARGIRAIAEPISRTLGPMGRVVVVPDEDGAYLETTDAATVAAMFRPADRRDELGASYIRQLVTMMRAETGDGAGTAVVLAQAMVRRATEALRAGANPVALKRGIEHAASQADEVVVAMKRDLERKEELRALASTVSFDPAAGEIIAEAIDKTGAEGVISVAPSQTPGLELKLTEGMLLHSGLISDYFITDASRMEAVLEMPYVLIADANVTLKNIISLLDKVNQAQSSLAIIADDIDSDALSFLLVNKIRGLLRSVAIKTPGTGAERRSLLGDMAILTGAAVVADDVGLMLENADLDFLGQARKIVVTKQDTTIIDGAGDPERISGRVDQIRKQIEVASPGEYREMLRIRLARLAGGVADIRVGGLTETDNQERIKRIDRTILSMRIAIREGWIPSAATALLLTRDQLPGTVSRNTDETAGVAIVADSLAEPMLQIARNAGYSETALGDLLTAPESGHCVDVMSRATVDFQHAGMLDPAGVARRAIAQSARIASRFVMIS
jgi:chaperonin GroEL